MHTLDDTEQWWFGANESTLLYRYDWKSRIFVSLDIYKKGSATERQVTFHFSRILKDRRGGIWIATRDQGLF